MAGIIVVVSLTKMFTGEATISCLCIEEIMVKPNTTLPGYTMSIR